MRAREEGRKVGAGEERSGALRWVFIAAGLFLLVLAGMGRGGGAGLAADPGAVPGDRLAREDIRYGPVVPVGRGSARSYAIMKAGSVVEVGVGLSEGALDDLPPGHAHLMGHPRVAEFLLEMPTQNPTPYRFIELDWVPDGHDPPGIYDRPHFDIHFYQISLEERNAIDPGDPAFSTRAGRLPSGAAVPAGFLPHHHLAQEDPGVVAVPRMGLHWIDPSGPEFNGHEFTHTLLYGTWDGRVIFQEPMVTRAFLQSKPDERMAVAKPGAGYAPDGYRIYWHPKAKEYRIGLTGLPQGTGQSVQSTARGTR